MNYNPILDAWFSNGWISFGVPGAIFFIVVFFYLKKAGKKTSANKDEERDRSSKKKQKSRGGLYTFVFIALAFGVIMLNGEFNQSWLGYGNSKHIVNVQLIDGKLYITDFLKSMGGKTSSGIKYYRLHVVDPVTGKKERRFVVGAGAKLLDVENGKAYIAHYGDLWSYDVNTGKRIDKYNRKTLPKMFPEWAPGVDNMSVNSSTLIITVDCKDGKTWYLNPKTNTTLDKNPGLNTNKTYTPTNNLYIDGNEIRKDDSDSDYGSEYLDIETKNNDGKRARIYDANDKVVYKDLSFLNGEPVVINSIDSSFVVLHFETTENERFILTCLKLDGSEQMWEIKQRTLNPTYRFRNYKESISITTDGKGHMFFGISGELFCIDLKDGKVIWRVQL